MTPDALDIIYALSRRGCEGRVTSMFPEQMCTHVNPCLTCKAKRVDKTLQELPEHPINRG